MILGQLAPHHLDTLDVIFAKPVGCLRDRLVFELPAWLIDLHAVYESASDKNTSDARAQSVCSTNRS